MLSDNVFGVVVTLTVCLILGLLFWMFFGDPHSGNILMNGATGIYNTLAGAREGLGL